MLDHLLAACFYQIFQKHESFINVSPVLAVVIESLPDHLHDLREGDHVVSQVGYLRHLGGGRTPGVVAGGLPDLDLGIRVVVSNILDVTPETSDTDSHRDRSRHDCLQVTNINYPTPVSLLCINFI